MSKKLKIKFWKAERALAMQILEQEGLPESKIDGKVRIVHSPAMSDDMIYLRGKEYCYDFVVENYYFGSNQDRDECLNRLVNAITDELFVSKGEVKVGELCEMSDDKLVWEVRRFAGKSAKQLGLEKRFSHNFTCSFHLSTKFICSRSKLVKWETR